MTSEQDKTQQRLRPLVLAVMGQEAPYEMAKAFLRYETLRKLTLLDFITLYRRNLAGEDFDQMIDELILTPPTQP